MFLLQVRGKGGGTKRGGVGAGNGASASMQSQDPSVLQQVRLGIY